MERLLKWVKDLYSYWRWRLFDKLFILTKKERFYYFDEQAVYDENVIRATPIIDSLPFHIFLPYNVERGKEYFIVCDHPSRFDSTKAAKVDFYTPKYINDGRRLGKKKWVLSQTEKESLVKFLENEIPSFTSGMSVFRNLIEQYNHDQNARGDIPELEIPRGLPMPNYMELPEHD